MKQIEREKMMQESQSTKKSHETGNDGNKLIGEVLAVKSRFVSQHMCCLLLKSCC